MSLAQAMKQRRAEIRKTAAECASGADMTSSEWSRWEAGQSRRKDGKPSEPRTETLSAIAKALDLSVTELRERAGMQEALPELPAEVFTMWSRVPVAKQRAVMDNWRSVVDLVSA